MSKIKKSNKKVFRGYFTDPKLLKKIKKLNEANKKDRIKTWRRGSTITPDFIGHTFDVHNGRTFTPVKIVENMVGHKLGEFSPTRKFGFHPGNNAEDKIKKAAPSKENKK